MNLAASLPRNQQSSHPTSNSFVHVNRNSDNKHKISMDNKSTTAVLMDEEEKAADISMPVIIQTESPRQINKAGVFEETKEAVKAAVGSQIVSGAGGLQTGILKPI